MTEARTGRPPGTPKTGGRKKGSRNKPKLPPPVTTDVAAGAEAAGAGGAPPDGLSRTMRARAREAGDPAFGKYRIVRTDKLIGYENNPRTHSEAQIAKLVASITEFGFTNPILTDGKRGVVAGHGRLLAAQKLGMETVPTLELAHLNEMQRRAYVIADNRLAEDAGWDKALLKLELGELYDGGFKLQLTGFELGELKLLLGKEGEGNTDPDEVPPLADPVSVLGDVWSLGNHTLHCADCRVVLKTLSGVDAVVTSPPYNMRAGTGFHMGHKGSMRPGVALAAGYASYSDDMPWAEYEAWQRDVLTLLWATLSDTGAIFYNHKPRPQDGELWLPLSLNPGLPLRQIIVWDRKGGINFSASHFLPMQEWILLFAKPEFRLTNKQASVEGDVWSFGPEGKPVHPAAFPSDLPLRALRAIEAQIVLDPFSGSGTTIIAAEMTGRSCIGIELSPAYVDVAIRRWQAFVGAEATHADGRTFAAIEAERAVPSKAARTSTRAKVAA